MAKGFLNDFVDMYKETESPTHWFYWTGLAVLSAIVRKNVWLDKTYFKLYPNIYMMIIAPPGGRKGLPINMARKFVQEIGNTKVIYGRSSIQAIMKGLSETRTSPDRKTPLSNAQGFFVSEELEASLVKDDAALTILTTLYDTHAHEPSWENTLKGSGVEVLKEPCLTLLGGSNPTLLREFLTGPSITGGFVRRILFTTPGKGVGKINSLVAPPTSRPDWKKLIPHLQKISKLKGGFTWDPKAGKFFDDWYKPFREKVLSGEVEDSTGYLSTFHDQVQKISMLISLSESTGLILQKDHIEEALEKCTESLQAVSQILAGKGKSARTSQVQVVLEELLKADKYKVTRQTILSRHYGDIDAADLDIIVDTLKQGGIIEEELTKDSVWYSLTKRAIDVYSGKGN